MIFFRTLVVLLNAEFQRTACTIGMSLSTILHQTKINDKSTRLLQFKHCQLFHVNLVVTMRLDTDVLGRDWTLHQAKFYSKYSTSINRLPRLRCNIDWSKISLIRTYIYVYAVWSKSCQSLLAWWRHVFTIRMATMTVSNWWKRLVQTTMHSSNRWKRPMTNQLTWMYLDHRQPMTVHLT